MHNNEQQQKITGNNENGNNGNGNNGNGNKGTGNHETGNHGTGNKGTGDHGNGEKPLRIVEFRAQNVMALKAIQIFPENKDVVILTGENRQGKSTIIRAIWAALGGKEFIPDEAIRRGEKEGNVYLDLGDFIVTLKITSKKEYLKVKTKDGMEASSPQKFLNSRLADLAHNPLEFMRLKPQEQVKALQGMLNLKLDRTELERLAGTWTRRTQGDDPMLVLDNVTKGLYEERAIVNAEVKRLQGVVESIKIPHDLADIQPVSIADLLEELSKLEAKQRENDSIRNLANSLASRLEDIRGSLKSKDLEIEEMEAKVIKLKQERAGLIENLDRVQEDYLRQADKVDDLTDPDFADIKRQIAEADSHNKSANEIAHLKDTLQKSKADLETKRKESQTTTDTMEALKAYKLRLIEHAALPLPGIGFEDGEVTFNGLPLSQASTREQIEISCAICLAQHPRIGIITIDVGWSELDKSGKQVLRQFARRTGAQIWVTLVREEPGHEGFHIVDGELVAVDGVPLVEDCDDLPDAEEENCVDVPKAEEEEEAENCVDVPEEELVGGNFANEERGLW
jgi:recombinational DNA repair ATPase RecF